jgi:hypothetical protein
MKVTMILLAMLAMLAIALAAPNQDKAEASGYRSNKHYDYPKKHYEDYEHKDRDCYETVSTTCWLVGIVPGACCCQCHTVQPVLMSRDLGNLLSCLVSCCSSYSGRHRQTPAP